MFFDKGHPLKGGRWPPSKILEGGEKYDENKI